MGAAAAAAGGVAAAGIGAGTASSAGLIAAGVGAAGALGSSLISSGAASSAAGAQSGAAQQAAAQAAGQYNQTRADLSPYRDIGPEALQYEQTALFGGNATTNLLPQGLTFNPVGGAIFQPTQAQLAATPGYQFDLAQGLQSVQNSNAASGRGVSGAALKGAANYATGLANNTLTTQQQIFQNNLQNQSSIFQNNLGNVLNPLNNLANLGQTAATQTGQQGLQATANANALNVGAANAQAAGTVGSANALAGGLSSLGSAPLNYALYNQLLGGGGGGGSNDPYNANNSNQNF